MPKPDITKDQEYYQNHDSEKWRPIVNIVGWGLVILSGIGVFCYYNVAKEKRVEVFLGISVNALILMAMFVQVSVAKRQWAAMREQRDMMQGQLEATKRQIETAGTAERAYFYLTDIGVKYSNPTLIIQAKAVNGGRTPAWGFISKAKVVHGETARYDWASRPDPEDKSFVPALTPKEIEIAKTNIDEWLWREIFEGDRLLSVDSECRYLDITGNLHAFIYGFTFEMSWDGKHRAIERYQEHYEPDEQGRRPN